MTGFEPFLIVAGWLLTAGVAGVTGTFVIQGRNNERVEKVRKESETKIEKLVNDNRTQSDTVLRHVQNVETMINNMRAELPEKYTLKTDFLRLEDKFEDLSIRFYKHFDKDPRDLQ